MKAQTTKTRLNRNRSVRRRRLAAVIAVMSLVVPATAGADFSSVNAITGGSEQSSQPVGGQDFSSVSSITGSSGQPGPSTAPEQVASSYRSPSSITGPLPDRYASGFASTAGADDGFHWGDAVLGAGTTLALLALAGAALLTVRRRTAVAPSAS